MSIEAEQFTDLLSKFATGVTVVTVQEGNAIHGLTVNAFSSVSLEPPLVLICIERDTRTKEYLERGIGFTISILSETQEDLSRKFARPGMDMAERLRNESYTTHEQGGPHFDDSLAWMNCEQENQVNAGDHTIYIGRVIGGNTENPGDKPLLYFDGEYQKLKD